MILFADHIVEYWRMCTDCCSNLTLTVMLVCQLANIGACDTILPYIILRCDANMTSWALFRSICGDLIGYIIHHFL